MDACTNVITERFEEICNREPQSLTHIMEIDLENFISILKSDGLNLVNEDVLIDIVREYIAIRDKVVPKAPDSAEGQTPPDLWALLTEEEKESICSEAA